MDAVANNFWATPGGWTLITVAQILAVVLPLLVALAFFMLADRKIWAGVQMRKGPNVVGPFGLLQSFADFFKFVLKEIIVPAGADKVVFLLAPLLTFILAFIAWAAIPFARTASHSGARWAVPRIVAVSRPPSDVAYRCPAIPASKAAPETIAASVSRSCNLPFSRTSMG